MSRTSRTPSATYYRYTPVTAAQQRKLQVDKTKLRDRTLHGYDGRATGELSIPFRAGAVVTFSHGDRGYKSKARQAIKRRAARLAREAACLMIHHALADMLEQP